MSLHGTHIMQTIVFVLEQEYSHEIKEVVSRSTLARLRKSVVV